jgi:hypothetical protein
MRSQCCTRFWTGPWKVVQQPLREARVGETLYDESNGKRRLWRRFNDQSAAGRQRRPGLPRIDVNWVIPGGNRTHHADGGCEYEAAHVGTYGSTDGAANPSPFFSVVPDHFDAKANLLDRIRDRFPLLASEHVRNGVQTFNDKVGGSVEYARSLGGTVERQPPYLPRSSSLTRRRRRRSGLNHRLVRHHRPRHPILDRADHESSR